MNKLVYPSFNETIFHEILDNGLSVYLIPKKDYHKVFATFTANYGSFDQSFVPINKDKKVNQPAGIAHFLEHKMFAMPDKTDAFEKLSSFGVNANAYTSFDRTSYLFSGTKNIEGALNYLLDYVQTPYFTPSSVKKEQGIIAEELKMYQDYPNQRMFYGILKNLYQKHPINTEVGGTVDSIMKITAKKLYQAYETFYHPSNMVLTLVGNFDENEILTVIKENQAKKTYGKASPIVRFMKNEPKGIEKAYDEIEMPVVMPKLSIGVKLDPVSGKQALKDDLAFSILMDMYFSNSTKLYEKLLTQGLINDSFEHTTVQEDGAFMLAIFADTKDVDALSDVLIKQLVNLKRKKHDEQAFTRYKRSMLGSFVMSLNSLESISMGFTRYLANDVIIYDIPEIIESITLEDIDRVAKQINSKRISRYVIKPQKKN